MSEINPFLFRTRSVPVLIVKNLWGDRGSIGKHCLPLAFFDFNDLKKKIFALLHVFYVLRCHLFAFYKF